VKSGWELFAESFWHIVWGGVTGTVPLALASFAIGLVLALGIALLRLAKNRVLSGIARFYVSVVRGTPLLVQLFVIFYGLPSIGLTIDPWPSAIIAFSVNVGGYAAEIIRAAILSVPKGQWEAGYTFISLVKDTSLASLILVTELFRVADNVAAFSQEFMLLYLEAALVYWIFCLVLSSGQSIIEKRLDRYVAH
jgi:cystine transport system permease protein